MELGVTVGESLERVDRLGPEYDFIELGIDEGGVPAANVSPSVVHERVAAANCALCVHLPFKQDLVTPVPEINDAILDFLSRLLEWASAANASKAVLHGTARDPHDRSLRETAREQLQAIADRGRDHGVEIVLENVGHQPRGFQLSVLAELAEQTDTALCFDIGHAYMEEGQDGIERFLQLAGERFSHLHMHDARKRGDTHLPMGAGEIDYSPLATRLADYSGTIAIEVFTDDEPLLADTADRINQLFGQ